MPGKHAPASPRSFYLSVARAVAGALGAVGLVVVLAIVAVSSRSSGPAVADGVPTQPEVTEPASPDPTRSPDGEPSPEPELRKKSKLSIRVLNGTERSGLAGRVFDRLDGEGYKMVKPPGNADGTRKSTIFYQPDAEADARAFLTDHPEFGRIKPATGSTPEGSLLVIVLGDDYERDD